MKKNFNSIATTVISPVEAANDGFYKWVGAENDCEFHNVIPGYICGFCVEIKRHDSEELGYGSCVFTNDFENILLPNLSNGEIADGWNDLGISADICSHSGVPTGRIVFRGYYTEHYDFDEREEYFMHASKEVEKLWNEYVA